MKQDQQRNLHVIFLHIPKTAGTTLYGILNRYYKNEETFWILGSRREETVGKFTSLPAARRSQIMLLRGHMPFGLHEYLPQPNTYITMLRNPVDRIVSHYYYVLREPKHHLHKAINEGHLDIEKYISAGLTTEMDNSQLRLLTGHIDDIEFGGCTSHLLDQAKSNLIRHFAVVGLSERFDESVLLMKRKLGWKRQPVYLKHNVAPRRPVAEELSPSALNTIRKHNELDQELYEWASERLQREFEKEEIQKELEKFRMANSIYQSYKTNFAYESYKRLRAMAGRLRSRYRAVAQRHLGLVGTKR